jgi:hypothetical protein
MRPLRGEAVTTGAWIAIVCAVFVVGLNLGGFLSRKR